MTQLIMIFKVYQTERNSESFRDVQAPFSKHTDWAPGLNRGSALGQDV